MKVHPDGTGALKRTVRKLPGGLMLERPKLSRGQADRPYACISTRQLECGRYPINSQSAGSLDKPGAV